MTFVIYNAAPMIGSSLAHYEITHHLGTGGMGEVYQATDSKLGRGVAVKLLPETFARDVERLARFQREARVLASLNHPSIAAIHGMEQVEGRHFLVLELVPGETLADKIARGPIALDEALDIARQIAEALEAAHDLGVVHRDLKPANVKLTPDGKVKVLDFGLAKALTEEASDAGIANSPTISLAATQRGVILGTAAYMAPEQARGRAVDRRADIWAFGVVLYEMLTGQKLFRGEDVTDTVAAVVREAPDLSVVPPRVREVLEKCLEKDPRKRLRHISSVLLLLDNPTKPAPPALGETAGNAGGGAKGRNWLPWAVAGLAAAGLAGLAFVHFRETTPELQAIRFTISSPPDATFANTYCATAPSPDGRHVIFGAAIAGKNALWIRPLASAESRVLPGTEGGNCPTWSPDSKSIVFSANGKLKRIELAGGAPLTLGDSNEDAVSTTASWNRNGEILFGSVQGLQKVSASGGGGTLLTQVDAATESGHGYPQFIDNDRFIYFVQSNDPNIQGVYSSSVKSPKDRRLIVRAPAKGVYVPAKGNAPDYLLWMQDQNLVAQRFNRDALQVEGDPMAVAEGVSSNPNVPIRAAFWANDSGLLTYLTGVAVKQPLVWIARDGKRLGEIAPEDAFSRISLAPENDRIAWTRRDSGSGIPNIDVWIHDLVRGIPTRLTFDAAADESPVWSPDGKQVAFSSTRDGSQQIYRKDSSGAGSEEQLTRGGSAKITAQWSHDGKYILYREGNAGTGRDLMALPLDNPQKPFAVVQSKFNDSTGAISPDGKWVAYSSNESGIHEIYVQAFPGVAGAPAGRWQISNGGGYEVRWRGDSQEIYYRNDSKMMAAVIHASPQGIRAEVPTELFSSSEFGALTFNEFDVTPDGKRFVMILNNANEGSSQILHVISNWQALLRK
jgi:Tol biopolymer transport system component